MKRIFLAIATFFCGLSAFAQRDDVEKSHKFKQENVFIGGAIGLGLGSGTFSVGANPEIGYSIAEWLDGGISTNVNYYTVAPEVNSGYRDKSFNYGVGVFARVYPVRGLFLQVLPEYNWIKASTRYEATGQKADATFQAPSLLLGIGYSTREIGSSSFYTVLMFDAGNNTQSPYILPLGSKQPILRTGFNFYLRPKRK